MLVTNLTGPVLYRNMGQGRFRDVTAAAGLEAKGWTTSATFLDYDNDGYLDLYFSALGSNQGYSSHGVLFHNNGTPSFSDVTAAQGLGGIGSSMNYQAAWGDVDNDGDLDVYVSNLKRDFLLQNNGDGTFTDREDVGILNDTMAWGVNFLDYDNDGDLDLCKRF